MHATWTRSVFEHEILDERPGFLLFRVDGKKASFAFANEPGGHRFQRVPPTEKRGRVHSSTITIAVLEVPKEHEVKIDRSDLEESFARGSGAGGQHRNKTDTCVVLKHKPSGIQVRVDGGRSQWINRQTALELLSSRLKEGSDTKAVQGRNVKRRGQVGSGMRSDKVRTVAIHRDLVTNHLTGVKMSAKRYLRGAVAELQHKVG